MRRFTPEELRRAVRGRWRCPAGAAAIERVSTDSRSARAGDVFFALRGENFDGHDFLSEAASAGCVAAVVDWEAPLAEQVPGQFAGGVVGVADTTVALGELAATCRRHLTATVVAVTGSNGKTTVKRMIDHILSRKLSGRSGRRSFNNAVGVPLTLFEVSAADDYAVCELGSSAPGEIASLARIVRPDVAVITSVAETHLEKLIDLEHVAAEKAAILSALSPNGIGVVLADSEPLGRALRAYDARLVRFGEDDSAELRLTAYEPRGGGGRFELNGRLWVELPIPGRHNALNALAAIAVAQRFGFDQDAAAETLRDYIGEEMRLEPMELGAVTVVNDAYNANPASLAAAVGALESFSGKRRVVVAADMLELGPRSVELHQAAGRGIADAGVDLLVGVGSLGRHIAEGAASAGHRGTEVIETVEAACTTLPKMLKGGDVVLLKGSRAMAMERLVGPIQAAFAGPKRQKKKKGRPKC